MPGPEPLPSYGPMGGLVTVQIMPRTHRHHDFELNYSLNHGLTYLFNGEVRSIPPNRFGFFWAATPHQLIRAAPGGRAYWFTIQMGWLAQSGLPPRFINRLMAGELIIDAEPSPRDSFACEEWIKDVGASSKERRELAFWEIAARIHRMALQHQSKSPRRKPAVAVTHGAVRHVEAMARFIALHYLDKLSIEDIAAEAKVNPHYAMTIFKKFSGMTLLDYIVQHRIFHAQRLLLSSNSTVLDIAMASGFGSLSRFYQAFEKIFHQSPGDYRRRPRAMRG